jgi:tetratricopeptide (TPR) repeat protein
MAEGRLDVAEAALTRAMQLDPASYAPVLAAADLALRQSRIADANQRMKKALTLAPNSAEVATAAGRLAAGQNRTAEAEAQFRRAIKIDPEFVVPYLDLAEMQLAMGKAKEAEASFRQAQKVDPAHAGAPFGTGRALIAQRDLRGAQAAFEQSASLDPKNPIPLVALAQVQSSLGESTRALATIDRAISVDALYLPAKLARVDILAASGQTDAAMKELDLLIAAQGASPSAALVFKQGSLYESDGNVDAAARSFRRAVEIDPKFAPALNNLAWISAVRRTDLDSALGWAKQATQLDPRSLNYMDTLATVYLARGDTQAAIATLTQALERDKTQPTLLYRVGQAHDMAGRSAQAQASYKSALDQGRPFPEAAAARKRLTELAGKP